MPFDDTTLRAAAPMTTNAEPVRNTLAAIGFKPVPRELADAHREHVIKQFANVDTYHLLMVEYGSVYWCHIGIGSADDLEKRPAYSTERFAAPHEVIEMYRDVNRNIRGATFSMEYFYTDPILNVKYVDANGVEHKDCLAVWDNGLVIALAEGTLKPRRRFMLAFVLSVLAIGSLLSPFF